MDWLTSDTSHLSRLTNGPFGQPKHREVNCTALPIAVADLVRDSLAENTRRAYLSDLAQFKKWGGTIPATEAMIATYLAQHADSHAAATLARWLTSLAKAHRAIRHPDPTKGELVRSVLRGIRRTYGSAPDQAKPLLAEDLFHILDEMGNDIRAMRDRALLLIGFAGGFRRSELVGLDLGDVETVRQGMIVIIRRSKTDQFGHGRLIGIPYGRRHHCPVAALDEWLSAAEITDGPLFRPVDRHCYVSAHRLSGEAVSRVIKDRLTAAGIEPTDYSGHSLRAGFATSAAQAGVASWQIRQQTGHASDAMLSKYIRNAELFTDNAAGAIL